MLAIVIPYYNFIYFEETLKSLENQIDKRFNVYIGNDASLNDPDELIKKYATKINLHYKVFSENLGRKSLVQHWERCIDLIEGEEWVLILGDDDTLSENYIDQFYLYLEEIKSLHINVVRYASVVINDNSKNISEVYKHPKIELATDAFYRKYKKLTRSSLSEYIFKRETYDRSKFCEFPLGWYSDDMAWLDFTNCGEIYAINEAVAYIRFSEHSISGKDYNFREKQQAAYLFYKKIIIQKLKYFTENQSIEILNYFQGVVFKRNQLTFNNWFILTLNLLKRKEFLATLKFILKFSIYKLK